MSASLAGVHEIRDPGLGNSAWLVDLGDGRALAVHASRDLRAIGRAAEQAGLRIAFAADTHLHADFLSGAVQLAADQGAVVLAAQAGARAFGHRGLVDDDEVDLGGLTLRALATPGHTDEHLAYLLLDGGAPLGVFSGGSLIAGSVARTDLVDEGRTDELARAQFASVRRLAALPPETALWPTHGAGTMCAHVPDDRRASTIGAEVAANPMLAAEDEDTFVRRLLGGLGSYPTYFRELAEVNRNGPAVLAGRPRLRPLAPADCGDRVLVDVRPVRDFAAGHPLGALSIALRPGFESWLGWLVPLGRPLAFVRGDGQDPDEIAWTATKIGFEDLAEVTGGIAGWRAAGLPTSTVPLVAPGPADGVLVDVRQRAEYDAAHVPGAVSVELGELGDRRVEGPVTLMCGHGERAMTGASLLARAGSTDVRVVAGGPQDWL